jgi:hypothetical protein
MMTKFELNTLMTEEHHLRKTIAACKTRADEIAELIKDKRPIQIDIFSKEGLKLGKLTVNPSVDNNRLHVVYSGYDGNTKILFSGDSLCLNLTGVNS